MSKITATIVGAVGALGLWAQGCAVQQDDPGDEVDRVEQSLTCNPQTGIAPIKAALAVAMANELGSLDPLRYFAWAGGYPWWDANGRLDLSGEAKNICASRGGCPNLDSILALQRPEVNTYISQEVLNVTALRNDLFSSFGRQWDHTMNLYRNTPYLLPEPHRLRLIGTVDRQGCGLHYEFEARKAGSDAPLDRPENLANNLVFFGGASNDYIDFYATVGEIGIDPTAGLNGTTQTDGACGYGFTIYDPTWYSYGKCCAYRERYGKWAVAPWAANTFYCKT